MPSIADISKLHALATYLLNERGYLVIGSPSNQYAIGQVIRKLWDVDIDQPIRIIAITDRSDWQQQNRIALNHFNDDFKRGFYKDREKRSEEFTRSFYRVITD